MMMIMIMIMITIVMIIYIVVCKAISQISAKRSDNEVKQREVCKTSLYHHQNCHHHHHDMHMYI